MSVFSLYFHCIPFSFSYFCFKYRELKRKKQEDRSRTQIIESQKTKYTFFPPLSFPFPILPFPLSPFPFLIPSLSLRISSPSTTENLGFFFFPLLSPLPPPNLQTFPPSLPLPFSLSPFPPTEWKWFFRRWVLLLFCNMLKNQNLRVRFFSFFFSLFFSLFSHSLFSSQQNGKKKRIF